MRILLAVDESENSHRVVQYVGSLLRQTPDVEITLFHVLKPMPRGLLEHGGSENPTAETQLSMQLRDEQDAWIRKERESECHVLRKLCETLLDFGLDMSRVAVKYGHEDDIARNILEEARSGHYDTIVVGRQGTSRIKQIFGGGVTRPFTAGGKGRSDLGGGMTCSMPRARRCWAGSLCGRARQCAGIAWLFLLQ